MAGRVETREPGQEENDGTLAQTKLKNGPPTPHHTLPKSKLGQHSTALFVPVRAFQRRFTNEMPPMHYISSIDRQVGREYVEAFINYMTTYLMYMEH